MVWNGKPPLLCGLPTRIRGVFLYFWKKASGENFDAVIKLYANDEKFIIASLLFLAGSALATGSQKFDVLLVARSIQGFGGGGLLTLSEILIADLTPLSERGKWIGILSMMWAIGCVSGPVVGGALAHRGKFSSTRTVPYLTPDQTFGDGSLH